MRAPHRIRVLVAGVSTALLGLGAIAVGIAPAAQAQTVTGFGNGTVGIPQTIQVTDLCPDASLSLIATYASGVQVTSPSVNSDDNGNATIFWTPNLAGVITSAAIGSVCGPFAIGGATIGQVGTVTAIAAANTAPVGASTLITVTVQSTSPSSYQPTGTVTVRNGSGAVVVTMGLTPGTTNGQSFAYWRFTPPTAGTYLFQATYSGDASATTSVSPVDTLAATASGGTISLTAPGTLTVGVPVTLVANVVPTNVAGSVGFTFNGTPISASVPLVNGVATFVWTPTVAGNATLGANYMTNGGNSGSTTDAVSIVAGPVSKDVITLSQPGVGPWAPNGVYMLGNGTSFTFTASTLSGSAVTLTESGPCQVSGLTLVIDTGSGQCNLSATSKGGPGYAGTQQGYTVNIVPGQQTATLAAPNSGRFGVGRTIRLQNPQQGTTNANQNVTWRVTSGGSRCRLVYPSSGAVNVRLASRGQCTVVARAAAVPNSWQAFSLSRTYTAR